MRDHHHTHIRTRTDSDFANIISQLEQAYAAYLTDTSKLEELRRAFDNATDAGCTDTAVYKQVANVLEAIQKPQTDDPAQQVTASHFCDHGYEC